jgi:hypothetical protein
VDGKVREKLWLMKKDLAKTEFTYSKQKEKMEHKTNTKL